MKKLLFSCLAMALGFSVQSQVVVDINQTVQTWVEDVLIGEGVDAFNVEVNGMPGNQIHLQVGGFMDDNGDIGLNEGFIMGTGGVTMASQPNTGGGSTVQGAGNNYSFAPLEDLTPFSVNDQCIVEFDFIPQGDTLTFNYVFASEEYEEYVCGTVNDVFGFFLSGTNPAGGIYTNENLALIPDPSDPTNYTTTPVSINTLNPGVAGSNGTASNCDDADPNWADYNIFYTPNTTNTYEYDGSSVVLTARAIVNCGDVYHITLAIGDGGDTAFDSAVFLEAGSFSAEPTAITAESLFPLGLVEISSNCDSGYARISRPCASDTAYYQMNYLVSDSAAEYGVDYEPLPTEFTLFLGDTDFLFPIFTIPDGVTEDTEYICIELLEAFNEGGPFNVIDTACIPIIDNYTFNVAVNGQPLYCPETVPVLQGYPQYPGVAPFDYEWVLNGEVVSTDNPYEPPIPGLGDTVYYDLQLVDFCGAVNEPATPFVANLVPADPIVDIVASGEYCPGVDFELHADRSGGTGAHTYTWTDDFNPLQGYPDAQTIFVDPFQLYGPIDQLTYKVVYNDNCNPSRTDSAEYTVTFPQPLTTEAFMNSVICTDQILELSSTAGGGYPPYTYTWSSDPALMPTQFFPIQFGFLQGAEGEAAASGFFVDESINLGGEFEVTLTLDDWCTLATQGLFTSHNAALDTDTVQALDCIYPNVVSPNGDGSNDSFIVNELINRPGTMFIYNRWGNLLAETNDNEWRIGDEADGTYFYVVQFDDEEEDKEKKGYFTIVR